MVKFLRRWLKDFDITIVGDSAYSVINFGLTCLAYNIRLIAPLRLDAALYEDVAIKVGTQMGRPRLKGKREPTIEKRISDSATLWNQTTVRWYGTKERSVEYFSGTSLWYHSGMKPLPIRWVVVKTDGNSNEVKAFFSTNQNDTPESIIERMVRRWSLETTFEEVRCHLGFETQRQWSDKAIERQSPCILSLYSLVVLFAHSLDPHHLINPKSSAWYQNTEPTFSDLLATVRSKLWEVNTFSMSHLEGDSIKIPRNIIDSLIRSACYAYS